MTPYLPVTWTDNQTGLEFNLVKGDCVQQDDASTEECQKPFYLSRNEISIAQYLAFLRDNTMGGNSSGVDWQSSHCPLIKNGRIYSLNSGLADENLPHPMTALNGEGAPLFVQWMNKRFPGKHFRLPDVTELALADDTTAEDSNYDLIHIEVERGEFNIKENVWEWGRKKQKSTPEGDGSGEKGESNASNNDLTQGFHLFLSAGKSN